MSYGRWRRAAATLVLLLMIFGLLIHGYGGTPTSNQRLTRLTQCFGCGSSEGLGHLGEDYGPVEAGEASDSVYAIRAGAIYAVDSTGSGEWGKYVVTKHPFPTFPRAVFSTGYIYVLYAHLSDVLVRSGDVAEGQLIGKMGTTSCSTSLHLHIGVVDRDPLGLSYYGSNFDQDRIPDSSGRVYYRTSLFFSYPPLFIDGSSSSSSRSGNQGPFVLFAFKQYTPRGFVSAVVRDPHGNDSVFGAAYVGDTGTLDLLFPACGRPAGPYLIWVIDEENTGNGYRWSNHVTAVITEAASCP
ncbi:MAG: hypothetical protein A2Z21_02125 [Candidatus Fraserbacteria bacterium RBG_16_55_9]|uniref:M23ase beta-sheet core domain-containing protein n=1 Tax=Fraserbacteria sp. (strain RBG_16_55_9) TaxID=1817864 RepID=A0A1F5V1D0_FRAXR|nr:MAG: hypothetical protein A2Z21_02125 [Candidatus Fraserbacteria bacterium RBG_16_55_9]